MRNEYVGKDAAWFAGRRRAAKSAINRIPTHPRGTPQPFMDKYTIVMDDKSAAVFDGKKSVAFHHWKPTTYLFVEPAYRRQGIGVELVRVCALAYPGSRASYDYGTPEGQRTYEKAWVLLIKA